LSNKVRCILLDDELPGLTYLRMLCDQIELVEIIRVFDNPLKLLQEADRLDFDICILDIDMPDLSGLEVARLLKNKPVIFTTAHTNYAAEAFDLDAIDYIRKPITKERLEKAIQKASAQLEKVVPEKQFVQINTNKGKTLLFFDHIIHITSSEIDSRDKLAFLESGEELVLKNISYNELSETLPGSLFCRINKKDLVSLRAVKFFSHDEITISLKNVEKKLPFSNNFKKEFLEKTAK
jgi:two-component system LytT family response regulator